METKILSLPQYVDKISSLEIEHELKMFPPKLMFRGQPRCYSLEPSLGRRPSSTWLNSWTFVEKDLVQSAQQNFPLLFPDSDYPVVLLAKLQHYGIYTRMLDITENALVALYFACNKDESEDGEVFVFQAQMHSAYDPIANVVADTYRLTENSVTPIENYYYRALHRPYATRWLYPGWETDMDEGIKRFSGALKRPIFIEAGTICERQKNQSGKFILFPNEIFEKTTVVDKLVTLERADSCILKKYTIDCEAKQTILQQLQRVGIAKDTLFSDDVDTVLKSVVDEQRKRYLG